MEVNKLNENKTSLPRKEVEFEVTYDEKTPSRIELKEKFVQKLKSKPELTIVRKINNNYGNKYTRVDVRVYDDEKSLKAMENKELIEKNQPPKKEEASEEEKTGEESKSESSEEQESSEEKKEEGEQ